MRDIIVQECAVRHILFPENKLVKCIQGIILICLFPFVHKHCVECVKVKCFFYCSQYFSLLLMKRSNQNTVAFTFWMISLIPRRLPGQKQIISGTTDEFTTQFSLIRDRSFHKEHVPRALEGLLVCSCWNETGELGHFLHKRKFSLWLNLGLVLGSWAGNNP